MKPKILKLSLVILLFLFIGIGCDKNDWSEVELSNFSCDENSKTVDSYIEIRGTISSIPEIHEEPIFIYVESPDVGKSGEYILPCNLPQEYNKEGLEVIFSGELKEIIDHVETNDSISSPVVLAQTIVLTNLQIKDYE